MNLKNIFFCDFDYTLYDHDNSHVTAENLRAVKRWREQGNLFVIATGRSLNELKVSLPDYRDYCDYLILNDGAVVMTVHSEPLHVDRVVAGDFLRRQRAVVEADGIDLAIPAVVRTRRIH